MVLVTGASGHIGNVLVQELVKKGEKVRIIIKTGVIPTCLEGLPLEVCKGDICDPKAVSKAVQGMEKVYHLASIISISSFDSPELSKTNIEGTQHIINACVEHNVNRLIYTSSVHALPEKPHGEIITESSDFSTKNLFGAYSRTKAQATRRILDAVEKGLDAVICFPSGVIGPFDYRGSEAGNMIQKYAKNSLKFYIPGSYNFVDVRDVVDGILKAGEKGRKGEGYLLAGHQMGILDLVSNLQTHLPHVKKPPVCIPVGMALASAWVVEIFCKPLNIKPFFTAYGIKVLQSNADFSNEKSFRELGYQPRTIQESLKDTVKWMQETGKI